MVTCSEPTGSTAGRVAYSSSLSGFFAPGAVAVIGASEREPSVGRTALWNLLSSPFGGTVYPVHPRRRSVLGVRAYRSLREIDETVDLSIVAVPATVVPEVMEDCASAGCTHVVLMSAFREAEDEEREAEARVLGIAREAGIRVLGPYSLGVVVPRTGLNATVTRGCARPGGVGFISQSGTMCSAILDWGEQANVGFSVFVSVGDMKDVDWGDLVYFLGDDRDTRVIILYMESVGDPKSFLSAAREVADRKPIIVIKGGRSGVSARGTASGWSSPVRSDDVFDAALKRSGVLRVDTIEDLFRMAEVLGKQALPKGRSLAIVSNAGGPAVLAIDSLVRGSGRTARLTPDTVEALDECLPGHWSRRNPIVGLGEVRGENYATVVRTVAADPGVDGVLVILTPKPTVDSAAVARHVAEAAGGTGVPVLASWMGGEGVAEGTRVLKESGIPCFPFPDHATRIFNYMWRYRDNLTSLYETPQPVEPWNFQENAWVREMLLEHFARARAESRFILTDIECKRILEAYGIKVLPTSHAGTVDEAAARAGEIGYPVQLKALFRLPAEGRVLRFDVLSAMGGYDGRSVQDVRRVRDEEDLRQTYELMARRAGQDFGAGSFAGVSVQATPERGGYEVILGSDVDPQFGPVILFGAGGDIGRVLQDCAVGLPPLNRNLARKLMAETGIYHGLQAAGALTPGTRDELETVLVRFGQLVVEQPSLGEFYIDPLIVGPEGVRAAGARGILIDGDGRRWVRPAIRPYPAEYRKLVRLKDGAEVVLRPIRPEDEPAMAAFHRGLSNQSVYNRYFSYMHVEKRTSHEKLSRECFTDYERNMIIVAEEHGGEAPVIGVGRLIRVRGSTDAEFAVLVEDRRQGQGLGRILLAHLIDVARREGVHSVVGYVLEDNHRMIRLCEMLGFSVGKLHGEDLVKVVLDLASPREAPAPPEPR